MNLSARPSRPLWLVLGALVLAWGLILAFFGPNRGGRLPTPELKGGGPGMHIEYDWKLRDLDGRTIDFARYRGRAVFLNLWATWCGPCVEELPSIEGLARNPRLKDVAFLCVSVDDDPMDVRRFLDQTRRKLPVFLPAGPIPDEFQTDGIPATFLIAPDGRIAVAEVGAARWDAPEVVDRLEQLAKVGASP